MTDVTGATMYKRWVLLGVAIGVLAGAFWAGSRYPDLNAKLLQGGETGLSAIGFDTLVDVRGSDPLPGRILGNAANWLYTNQRGMAFGLALGALVMTLLPLLEPRVAVVLNGLHLS